MTKIALLFPGIGSEYVGMGKDLYKNFSVARQTFEEASDALKIDLAAQCFNGRLVDLKNPIFSQPATLTVNVTAFRVYMKEIGVEPVCCAGHSSGEISALTSAGCIKFQDAVKLVHWCGKHISEVIVPDIGLMALTSGIDPAVIEEECRSISQSVDDLVVIANYNSADQIAISGHRNAVRQLGERLKSRGAVVVFLKATVPFHTPLMEPVVSPFKMEMAKYQYFQPKFQVISNSDALPYPGSYSISDKLGKQIAQPVLWKSSMEYIDNLGVETAIELGPLPSLMNLMKKNVPHIATFSLCKSNDLQVLEGVVFMAKKSDNSGVQYKQGQINRDVEEVEFQNNEDVNDRLVRIICRVFGVSEFNPNDNFHCLGGDSIFLLKFLDEIEKEFKSIVDISDIFTYPSVKQLANKIKAKSVECNKEEETISNKQYIDDILFGLATGEISLEEADKLII